MTRRGLTDLARHSTVYALGNFLQRAIGFLLIPVYTRLLTPADYGILEILNVSLEVILIFCQFGVGTGLMRALLYQANSRDEQKIAFATAFWFVAFASSLVLSTACLFSRPIANLTTGNPDLSTWFRLIFVAGILQVNASVVLRVYRAELRSVAFCAIQLAAFTIGLVLNIYFLAVLHTGVRGVLFSEIISSAFLFFTSAFFLRDFFTFSFSWPFLRGMLRFGAPFIPAFLSMWVLTGADRYFLQHFSSATEVGLYSLGMRFALILQFLFRTPLDQNWAAVYYPLAKQPGGEREIGKLVAYVYAAGCFLALGIGLFAGPAIRVLASPAFHASQRVVPILLAAVLLNALNLCVSVGVNVAGRSEFTSMIALPAAALNLLLNWWLVPPYGMMGAAAATAFSFAAMVVAHYLVSQRLYRVEYDWGRILKATLALAVPAAIRISVPTPVLPGEIALAVGLLALYPTLLFATGFIGPSEARWLRERIERSAHRLGVALGVRT
ncbi:MAG: lipopolysaccharide biosynthesis protein [candidate division KSB1 bacterium]|nr:lipopolysaccharide biosynthesis protein [candidate division KSB1 bacterium]